MEWQYGTHVSEEYLSYLVVEGGHHTLDDGTEYDAQTVEVGDEDVWVSFKSSFSSPPVVFSQIVTSD